MVFAVAPANPPNRKLSNGEVPLVAFGFLVFVSLGLRSDSLLRFSVLRLILLVYSVIQVDSCVFIFLCFRVGVFA